MNYIYGMMMISPLLKYFDGPSGSFKASNEADWWRYTSIKAC